MNTAITTAQADSRSPRGRFLDRSFSSDAAAPAALLGRDLRLWVSEP
jgi:hypothetical protein